MQRYSKLQCSAIVTSEASDCVKKILGLLADVYLHPLSKFHEFPGDDSSLGHDTVAGYSGACHHPHSWATKQVSSVTELSAWGYFPVETHPHIQLHAGSVGDLQNHKPRQQIKGHARDLSDVFIT